MNKQGVEFKFFKHPASIHWTFFTLEDARETLNYLLDISISPSSASNSLPPSGRTVWLCRGTGMYSSQHSSTLSMWVMIQGYYTQQSFTAPYTDTLPTLCDVTLINPSSDSFVAISFVSFPRWWFQFLQWILQEEIQSGDLRSAAITAGGGIHFQVRTAFIIIAVIPLYLMHFGIGRNPDKAC